MRFRPNSLSTRVLAGTIGIVLLVGAALAALVDATVHRTLHGELEKRGRFMAHEVANELAELILEARYFEIDMQLKDLMAAGDDIEYYFVTDPHGRMISHTFGAEFPVDLRTMAAGSAPHDGGATRLATERGTILDFSAPIMGGKLGAVHVGLDSDVHLREIRRIVLQVLLVMALVLVLGTGGAILLARSVSAPVRELIDATRSVGAGDLDREIPVSGPDEIRTLARSFQDMVRKRKQAEQGKESLISELQDALDNVKTLEGLMPICASCKKIRDDKGYWTQIEAYLSKHSGAEFSHSICPECTKKLYPDFYKKKTST